MWPRQRDGSGRAGRSRRGNIPPTMLDLPGPPGNLRLLQSASSNTIPGVQSMRHFGRTLRYGAALAASLVSGGQVLLAQGVTSAAVRGRVSSEARGTVENAVVALLNTSTGARQQTSTNGAGRYNFENVPPGGPYTLEVRAIGFQSASKSGIMLALGQRYLGDFELKQQVVTLEELTVVAATNPLINSRSEEHTSELQSRFGISYAVF